MLEQLLELEINLGQERDTDLLLARYNRCSLALRDFLALKISFSDYCDILNDNGIEMDEYLGVINCNLEGCYVP